MNNIKKILNELGEFFSLTPILGTIKISEELARNYNLYENTMIEKSNPNLVPELRNKLDYLSEKSYQQVEKSSLILSLKIVCSFLFSYLSNTPLYFTSEILALLVGIYSANEDKTQEEEMLELLEYFKD